MEGKSQSLYQTKIAKQIERTKQKIIQTTIILFSMFEQLFGRCLKSINKQCLQAIKQIKQNGFLIILLRQIRHMEGVNSAIAQVSTFIRGDKFFEWHGIVLSTCWLLGSVIAILARKVSVQLHAILFFLIDAATAFFIVGAMIRVYPHIQDKFDQWDIVKKSHFIGGGVFLVLLVIQHVGGVSTLLKGIKYNSTHRKLGYVVSNLGRFIAIGGQIIGNADKNILYISAGLTAVLFIASTYKVFFAGGSSSKPNKDNEANKKKA